MISSPNKEVQPILLSYDNFAMLESALKEAEKEYKPRSVEIAFHESRINTFKSKIQQHEARKAQLEDPDYNEEDDIPMEEVEAQDGETN
jgi:chromosome segregation ATPase